MQISNDFFTATSIVTFAGATLFIWVITSALGLLISDKIYQNNKKWVAFGLAFILSFVAASVTTEKTTWTWIIAIGNGFLLFLTAMGANKGTAPTSVKPTTTGHLEKKAITTARKFNDPW